ncbi:MAG: 2OG-Fe dioxygenase family protein [Nitrosomonadales bacterium]
MSRQTIHETIAMTITMLTPAFTPPQQLADAVKRQGYGVLNAEGLSRLTGIPLSDLNEIQADWNDLPPDNFLKDGGRYRRRRHSCFIASGDTLLQAPHRAHYQPLAYNALHGGMHRLFEPMATQLLQRPLWPALLLAAAGICSTVKGPRPWYIEAHQFRIDTSNGIGRPTPEGAHRDGVDFVAILLVNRHNVSGGESRIFEADGPNGQRFTLSEPWTLLLLDDQRVIHESTPIQPTADGGYRDTLVLTFRSGAFLDAA